MIKDKIDRARLIDYMDAHGFDLASGGIVTFQHRVYRIHVTTSIVGNVMNAEAGGSLVSVMWFDLPSDRFDHWLDVFRREADRR